MSSVITKSLNDELERIPARKRTVFMYVFYAPIPLLIVPLILLRIGKWIDRRAGLKGILPKPLNYILAVLAAITSSFFLLWSWYCMVRIGKGHPFSQPDLNMQPSPSKLVTTGPFALCRNPQSFAGLMGFLSMALFSNSVGLLFAVFPAAAGCWHMLVRYSEEPGLERKFGEEYSDYAAEVPRYIPLIRRRTT